MQKGVDKTGGMMYTVKVAARETETVATSVIENWTTKRKKHKELKKFVCVRDLEQFFRETK